MSTANTFIEEDGFGLVERPDHNSSSSHHRCYETVRRYTMTNKGNSSVRLITWGAGIQSIKVPNAKGIIGDVVLGYDSMDGYSKNWYFGNVIGRIRNLVSPTNEDSECREGKHRFENVNWESYILGKQVVMSNLSNSSVDGWSGDMLTQVKFSWTDDNELHLNIRASSTGPVPSNITTRCLLNLAGHGTGPKELRNHVVTINASKWTFMDVRDKVPTGAIRPVDSTIYDLRFPTQLTRKRLRQVPGGGYDHNLCIDAPSSWCYRFHARILHPSSGRFMEVYSNQPGVQFYTCNDLPEPGRVSPPNIDDCCWGDCGDRLNSNRSLSKPVEETPSKDGVLYRRHGGFGIFPQNYPNAINTEGFPTCILYPGKIYAHDMTYKFGTVPKSKKTREAVAADHQVESASTIPWSEWTDAELKAEKWDLPKNGTDGHFLDPEPRLMPPSIEPHDWKRGSSLRNLSSNPVVFAPSNEYPDFVKNNKHILHSQFVRWFISTMLNLQYVGHNGLQVEGDSPNFAWLGKSPWQGWMYVYSMNKTGSSASQNRPVVNPHGKYLVRLFFMGSWRRFIVDDMIPVDENGSPLLPRTEKDFELWPMILAKAMMKLAALSWTGQREIADFHPVSCLTGWICLPLDTKLLSESEKWGLLIKYVDREDEAEIQTKKQSVEDKKKEDPRPTVAIFANFSNAEEAVDPDVARCLNYPIYIDKAKDMTLDKSQANNRWKLHRYFDWVSKHSAVIGSKTGRDPAIRSLKMIIPLRQSSTEDIVADSVKEISVWTDFRKIAPYLDEIFMFYKPSDFEYYTRVSDVLNITSAASQLHVSAAGSRVKSQATVLKDGKKAQTESGLFQSSVKWQHNISGPKNSPLYMLIDSVDAKFVLIEFCAPNPTVSARSHLIFEEHNFFEISRDDDPAVLVKTVSTNATIFEAEPGRHLYRVFFRPAHSYFIRILSDTIFHVGDRFKMYELMGLESDRVDAIVKNISDRINEAIEQFGRPGYAKELRALYNSYMPLGAEETRSTKSVHRLFITELEKLINETFSDVESRAICQSLRVFFLDPLIGVRCTINQTERHNPTDFSIAEKAAVNIQSFFRMALIKIYKNIHDPSHIRHSAILQSLRRVVELFDYSKRESIATLLIRQIIWSTCTLRVQSPLYPCFGDLDQVLNVEEWKGVVKNVQPGQWVPILRTIVNAPSENATVYAGIDLVTSLPRYVIRVVNNDTYHEVKRFVTKVATAHYPYVRLGYTVIGYGWSDGYKSKELGWSVRVTTVKGRPTFRQMYNSKSFSFVTKPPTLVVHELSNNYIPNLCNVIGKWIVTVSIDSLLSFRLSTSYNMVESEMKIYDKYGKVLCQASGGSVLILPVAYLSSIPKDEGDDSRARNRSKSSISDSGKNREEFTTEYYLQAYVTNDSWPLTSNEWTVANEARARGTVYDPRYGRTSVSSVSKRSMKTRVQNLHGDGDVTSDSTSQTIFQHPLCRLQVLVDAGAKVHIEEDRRREIEISSMKRLWEDSEPGRLLRGRELREEFFKSNSTVLETLRNSGNSDSMQDEIRTLKPWSNLSRILPPWNTTAYVLKDDVEAEDDRWVKTEDDEEMLRNQRAINSLDFYQSQAVYMEEEIGLFEDRRRRCSNLWNSYMIKSDDWNSLADAVCQKRDDYVSDVKTAMSNGVNKTKKNNNKNNKK